jgi:hypothetical protein
MPFSRKFREGMGFPKESQVVNGFTVESVSVSHVNVGVGRYEYPFELIVKGKGNTNKVKATFKEFFKTRRTLFSEFGNPYQCQHGKMEVKDLGNGKFSVTSRGSCTQVFLKDEFKNFVAYFTENGYVAGGKDEAEWKETIEKYLKQYEKLASRKNPVFR